MDLAGKSLDTYALEAELGRGGMGSVYRARTLAEGPAGPAGTTVAVKVVHPHLVADGGALERFQREAEIGRRLHHPNVVRTHAAGRATVDGQALHYMVMEFVEGQTLEDLRRELGIVPDHLLYPIAEQTLAGLQAIHDEGIVHRDLKPANIVITNTHKVLLMDLGVARMTATGFTLTGRGEFVGSLHYAAPEQLTTETDILPPADLYSLGVVLYELTTGALPVDAAELGMLLHLKVQAKAAHARDVRAEVDPFWDEVIFTCLQRSPTERFASAAAMKAVLAEGRRSDWWRRREAAREPSGAERALRRLRLERETALVGRDAELDLLGQAWRAAREGRGGVAFVSGPGGVGKSRLVYDFLERTASATGPSVGAGRAAGRAGRAWQAFLEIARDLLQVEEETERASTDSVAGRLAAMLPDRPGVVGPLASLLVGEAAGEGTLSRDAVHAAFEALLRRLARSRPLVLVLEDLHQAGEDTLGLLEYAARNLRDVPVLILGVYDDEQVDAQGPLQQLVLRLSGDDTARRVPVRPLAREACDALLRAVVGSERTVHSLGDLLHRRSDGNPLIILEVVAQLKSTGTLAPAEDEVGWVLARDVAVFELPRKTTELVHFKLAGLDDEMRETLDAAAVLGQEFQASVLAAMLEERRIKLLKRLAVLERTHRLIQSSGKDAFRFAKRQVEEVLYRAIPPDLRVEYHALAADTLLERDEGEAVPPSVAFQVVRHLLQAEREDEVAPLAEAACRHAVANHHATYARIFLERVAAAVGDADPLVLCDVRLRQWDCYEALGLREEQVEALEEAHALAAAAGDPGRQARAACLQGDTRWRTGDLDGAGEKAEEALRLAREANDRVWEASALHTLGTVAHSRGDFQTVKDRWEAALAIRREIGDRHGEARSLANLAAVMPRLGESARALETNEQALAIFRELGIRRGECALLNNIGTLLVEQERVEDAIARFEEAIAIAREIGNLTAEGYPTCNLGRAYALLGDAAPARTQLLRALEVFREARAQNGVVDALHYLAEGLIAFGDRTEAEGVLIEGVEAARESGLVPAELAFETRLAAIRAALGRSEDAEAGFERSLELAGRLGHPLRRVEVLRERAGAALERGDAEGALSDLRAALESSREATAAASTELLLRARLARSLAEAGRVEEARLAAKELAETVTAVGRVPRIHAEEVHYVLARLLPDEAGREHLETVRRLVAKRSASLRDPAVRDHYLHRTWPARELSGDLGATRTI